MGVLHERGVILDLACGTGHLVFHVVGQDRGVLAQREPRLHELDADLRLAHGEQVRRELGPVDEDEVVRLEANLENSHTWASATSALGKYPKRAELHSDTVKNGKMQYWE